MATPQYIVCSFCVNQNYDRVMEHSPLSEFLDPDRPKIKRRLDLATSQSYYRKVSLTCNFQHYEGCKNPKPIKKKGKPGRKPGFDSISNLLA